MLKRLCAAALLVLTAASSPDTGPLTVTIGNVRNAKGHVHVDICPKARFLKDCPYSGDAPARLGTTVIVVPNVPYGTYAAQATHDENSNRKVDRALFGIPKEGVGFSNDAKIRTGPPKYDEAAFVFSPGRAAIGFKLRYFL